MHHRPLDSNGSLLLWFKWILNMILMFLMILNMGHHDLDKHRWRTQIQTFFFRHRHLRNKNSTDFSSKKCFQMKNQQHLSDHLEGWVLAAAKSAQDIFNSYCAETVWHSRATAQRMGDDESMGRRGTHQRRQQIWTRQDCTRLHPTAPDCTSKSSATRMKLHSHRKLPHEPQWRRTLDTTRHNTHNDSRLPPWRRYNIDVAMQVGRLSRWRARLWNSVHKGATAVRILFCKVCLMLS